MNRWLVWLLYLGLLTTFLVLPGDLQDELPLGEFVITHRMVIAKFVHVGAYALFAVLSGWVRASVHMRPALVFVMMLHAAATEFIQLHVPFRGGSLSDVLFDHLGIAVGACLSWKWWTKA